MNVEQVKLDYVLESWKDEVDYANRYPSLVVVCHSYRRATNIYIWSCIDIGRISLNISKHVLEISF